VAKHVLPETASELRRLAAKKSRQDDAVAETRDQLARVMHRAVRRENARPGEVAAAAGMSRVHAWNEINRIEKEAAA